MDKTELEQALRKAFEMGQEWGSQAYSDFSENWKFAGDTEQAFEEFVQDTLKGQS